MEMSYKEAIIIIIAISIFLVTLVIVGISCLDGFTACKEKKLESKIVIIQDKFVQNMGRSGDKYFFLDEKGNDYEIYGRHDGARYTKIILNETYQIKVNARLGISCEEVLLKETV